MKKIIKYFNLIEWLILISSLLIITLSFFIFDGTNYITFLASMIGAVSLIFNSKGNFVGQILIIIFCTMYGITSFIYQYYGEVITYVFMTLPMAIISLITWIKNPYQGKKTEVEVNKITKNNIIILVPSTIIVTICFYFILNHFKTPNLIISTLSITTSFLAIYLTALRNQFFSLAYALNDIVLIILWLLMALEDISCVSMVSCFGAFLINDIYCFIAWTKMYRRQKKNSKKPSRIV